MNSLLLEYLVTFTMSLVLIAGAIYFIGLIGLMILTGIKYLRGVKSDGALKLK
jgi:hypothetical protein